MERQVLMDGGEQQQHCQLSSQFMRSLAIRAGEASSTPNVDAKKIGASLRFTDYSPLLQLAYIDAKSFWIVPFAHAFLYGVVKDFVVAILAAKSRGHRVQVRQICHIVQSPYDC
jgi:hypothetical protein